MFKIICLLFAVFAVALSFPGPDRRIVGGGNIGLGVVPSIVSIRGAGTTPQHFSGGVLISATWVLTGALYMLERGQTSLIIVAGIVDLSSTGQSRTSSRIVISPQFDRVTRQFDIACVELSTPITFGQHVLTINMHPSIVPVVTSATISGWGSISGDKGDNSPLLRRLSVVTVACPTIPDGNRVPNEHPNICAQGFSGTGICTSDVGGPLIDINGLIGIASWHPIPCAPSDPVAPDTTPRYPDVYVRISTVRNWVTSITGVQ